MHAPEFRFKPSRVFITLLAVYLAFLGLLILFQSISLIFKLFLLCAVMGYGGYILWRYGFLKGPDAIHGLKHMETGEWLLYKHNMWQQGILQGDSTVTRWVMVLRFKLPAEDRKASCIVFYDSLNPDLYRQLMMVLRF